MKLTIAANTLKVLLQNLAQAVSHRSTLPILSNVLFTVAGSVLKVRATNLDLEIQAWTLLTSNEHTEGEFTINYRRICDVVDANEGRILVFDCNEKSMQVCIAVGGREYVIQGLHPSEFPESHPFETFRPVSGRFSCAMRTVSVCMSWDETRYVLTGVLVDPEKGLVVATDGRRLSRAKFEPFQFIQRAFIIPYYAVETFLKIMDTGAVSISVKDYRVCFKTESMRITSKLIEGNYPNYEQVIPKDIAGFAVPRLALIDEIRAVHAINSRQTGREGVTRLTFKNKTLLIDETNSDPGSAKSSMPVETEAELRWAGATEWIIEGLSMFHDEHVNIQIEGEYSPLKMEDGNTTYVLMPKRIS